MHRRWLIRVALFVGLAGAGIATGYALRAVQAPPTGNHEIREGRHRLINPLLECEVAGYRRGEELQPFQGEIETLTDTLLRRGVADRISIYFRDLDNGLWFGIREDETFTPASLLKVPTILAVLAQAERNPKFFDVKVRYDIFPGDQPRGGYVPDDHLVHGRSYTVDELLLRAAAYSDNAAVALLGQHLEKKFLNRLVDELGLPPDLADLRRPAALSPQAYGRLFRVLYNASYLGRNMSERALGYFARSAFNKGIVAGLPAGIPVAHKFGIYVVPGPGKPQQLHDCGIVYHEQRPYFLCVMTEGRDVNLLAEGIREISQAVYEAVSSQTEPTPAQKN